MACGTAVIVAQRWGARGARRRRRGEPDDEMGGAGGACATRPTPSRAGARHHAIAWPIVRQYGGVCGAIARHTGASPRYAAACSS